ncbi:MAG: hypothetical protein AAB691_01115 [Patescibacteria group bacterium]
MASIVKIVQGPGKWGLLLGSLYEGHAVSFTLAGHPQVTRIFVRITSVTRKKITPDAGEAREWVIQGVVARQGVSEEMTGRLFVATYFTDSREGTVESLR